MTNSAGYSIVLRVTCTTSLPLDKTMSQLILDGNKPCFQQFWSRPYLQVFWDYSPLPRHIYKEIHLYWCRWFGKWKATNFVFHIQVTYLYIIHNLKIPYLKVHLMSNMLNGHVKNLGCAQHFVSRNIFKHIYFFNASIVQVPKHYTMIMYGEVKVKLFAVVTLSLIGRIKWSDSRFCRLSLRKPLYILLK